MMDFKSGIQLVVCSSSRFRPPPNPTREEVQRRQEEEVKFQELKILIVDTMMKLKNVSENDMRSALEHIISPNNVRQVNIAEGALPCAYVHRHGAHGMGLTRLKLLDALRNCEDLELMFRKPNVNVVSLGGGPGNDVVGLISALYECDFHSRLNVTVVDSVESWSSFVNTLRLFVKEGNFGNVSQYFRHNEVNLSFLKAALPLDSNENPKYQVIREADVILMVRFVSSVEADLGRKIRSQVIKHVHENMQSGAIAVQIDICFYESDWLGMENLYKKDRILMEEYRYEVPNPDSRFGCGDANSSRCEMAVLRRDLQVEAQFSFQGYNPKTFPSN